MKPFVPFLSFAVVLLTHSTVMAKGYGGKCLYIDHETFESKFHSCLVTPTKTDLKLIFEKPEYKEGNQTIVGNTITQIASGNYAKRLLSDSGSIIGSILFAPIGIASRLFKKDFQEYVVDYTLKGEKKATVVRVKPKDAPEFQQDLRALSKDMRIRFDAPKKSTVIDVGPDIQDIK